jgi:hypothetical protein
LLVEVLLVVRAEHDEVGAFGLIFEGGLLILCGGMGFGYYEAWVALFVGLDDIALLIRLELIALFMGSESIALFMGSDVIVEVWADLLGLLAILLLLNLFLFWRFLLLCRRHINRHDLLFFLIRLQLLCLFYTFSFLHLCILLISQRIILFQFKCPVRINLQFL